MASANDPAPERVPTDGGFNTHEVWIAAASLAVVAFAFLVAVLTTPITKPAVDPPANDTVQKKG